MSAENQLPDACCAKCRFTTVEQAPPPNLQKVRLCKRFPPVPVLVPVRGGATLTAMWPPMQDNGHCHEFSAAEPAQLMQLAE